jgi:hypothetical protein
MLMSRLRTSSTGSGLLLLALACTPLDDLSSYSEGSTLQQGDSSRPLAGSGVTGSLEPTAGVEDPAGDMTTSEENVPSGAALDVTSAGTASGAAAPADDEATAPTDDETAAIDDETAAPPTVVSDCGATGGFTISSTSSCYLSGDATFSWEGARDLCLAWGGDLVEIGSADENEALAVRVTGTAWIGVNDEEQEGAFRWSGGGAVDYTAWAPDQPDDWQGGEDCGVLNGFNHLWNDRPCTDSFSPRALCERVPTRSNTGAAD